MSFYKKIGKKIFDFIASVILFFILFPILISLYIVVRIKLGKPCLFKQKRPGQSGKIFTLYKFRTMKDTLDSFGNLLPDERRMTSFGNFLRKTSLDELPELVNVMKGNISLVGPRPLLVEYLPHYTSEQARRHEVKPGMTGWAQVSGRNSLSWDEKFKLDVWYVDNMSFLLDIKIILLTVYVTFFQKGIHAEGHVTMPKFSDSYDK